MAILFKKNKVRMAQGGFGSAPITDNYDAELGPVIYNNTEDINKFNADMASKVEGWRNTVPSEDLMKSYDRQGNFYKQGAEKFISMIGNDAFNDLSTRRRALVTQGVKGDDLGSQLYNYALSTYGDKSFNKSDLYNKMTPRDLAILKEANRRTSHRKDILPAELVERFGHRPNSTAGANDANDEMFGWRNFITPKVPLSTQAYRDVWNTKQMGKQVYKVK